MALKREREARENRQIDFSPQSDVLVFVLCEDDDELGWVRLSNKNWLLLNFWNGNTARVAFQVVVELSTDAVC